MCKLLFEGIVKQKQEYFKLLVQNKYYFIPTVNVDGAQLIEDTYKETGVVVEKRTNMNINTPINDTCTVVLAGVDLNRNYGYSWGTGSVDKVECLNDTKGNGGIIGKEPFSESETRAMRDFMLSKKNELKFVINFHSYGKMVIIPLDAEP